MEKGREGSRERGLKQQGGGRERARSHPPSARLSHSPSSSSYLDVPDFDVQLVRVGADGGLGQAAQGVQAGHGHAPAKAGAQALGRRRGRWRGRPGRCRAGEGRRCPARPRHPASRQASVTGSNRAGLPKQASAGAGAEGHGEQEPVA